MTILLTTDLHLSEKVEDQYRFDLFPWIVKHYRNKVHTVIILGDLTDRKNYHADFFVNKVVDSIRSLAKHFEVFLLCGNHDYDVDPTQPFFSFLGKYKNVNYILKPLFWQNKGMLFLPHSRDPGKDWSILSKPEVNNLNAIFMHQTFRGAITESGYELGGISPKRFKHFKCPVFSGDIHVQQQLGPITYVGCPYHIRYGDQFEPRLLLLDYNFETQDIHFPAPRKIALELTHGHDFGLKNYELQKGDKVKVRLYLPRNEFGNWPKHRDRIRKMAKKIEIKLHSIILKELRDSDKYNHKRTKNTTKIKTHVETYDAFCGRYDIGSNVAQTGSVFLEE